MRREDAQAGGEERVLGSLVFTDHEKVRRIGFESGGRLIGAAEDGTGNRNRGTTGVVAALHGSAGSGVEKWRNARERSVEQAVDVAIRGDTELAGGGDTLVITNQSDTLQLAGDVRRAGLRNQIANECLGHTISDRLGSIHEDAGAVGFEIEDQRIDEAVVKAAGEGHGPAPGGGVEGHDTRDRTRHIGGAAGSNITRIIDVAIDVDRVSAGDDHLADGDAGDLSCGGVGAVVGADQAEGSGAIHRISGECGLGAGYDHELARRFVVDADHKELGGGHDVIRVVSAGQVGLIEVEIDGSAPGHVGRRIRAERHIRD